MARATGAAGLIRSGLTFNGSAEMRAMLVIFVGLIVGYYLGCFAAPLTLVRGSAGEVNAALSR